MTFQLSPKNFRICNFLAYKKLCKFSETSILLEKMASKTETGSSKEKLHQIDLTKLQLPQLQQLKQEFESELAMFQESLQTMKMVKKKFADSKEALEQIDPTWKDKEILVPLTESMYVPGTVKELKSDSLIIDIGTGYYAEKDLESAKDYFKRKYEFIQEQVEKIDTLGAQKSEVLNAVMDVIEMKVAAIQKQQQEVAAASSAASASQ